MTYKLYEDETERFRMALEAIVSLYEDGSGKSLDMFYVAKAALNVTPRPKSVTTRGGDSGDFRDISWGNSQYGDH